MALRKFAVGNSFTTSWNPVEERDETQITQNGVATYSAKVTTYRFNSVTEEGETKEYPLTLGVVSSIDITTAMTVKVICTPISPSTFNSAKSLTPKDLPYSPNSFEYQLLSSEISSTDSSSYNVRQFVVTTGSSNPEYKVIVGNSVSYDPVSGVESISQEGEPTYSASIQVRTFDQVTETEQIFDTPLTLGVSSTINFRPDGNSATYVYLKCVALEGQKFSSASNGSIEIAFNRYDLSYMLTTGELPPNEDSSRQYLVKTVADDPTPDPKPTITNNYSLTRAELKEFQTRIFASKIPGETITPAWEFVSNVFVVPFIVPSSEIGSRENIKARDLTFNIADRLKGDSITLDMGVIEIPSKYNNSLDYKGSEISLYMPFKSGDIKLDPSQVIGGSVRLEYKITPSDGNTTLNIYNKNGELIQTSTFNVGSEYPFYSFYDVLDKTFTPENVVNDLRKGFVVVKIPNYDGVEIPKVTVSGDLEGVVGRVRFSEVSVDNIPYSDEYDTLISKLKSGVVIK